jgi:uncharacterized protein (TIGR02246 family)
MKLRTIKWPFAVIALQSVATQASGLADKHAIRELEYTQADTWNSHDAKRYSTLFEEDADLVDIYGSHWGSREQIEEKLAEKFRVEFVEIAVRFLKPDIAIAHVAWNMRGATGPGGGQLGAPSEGLQTQILVKRGGRWSIAAMQNTNWSPEEIWIVCAPAPPDFETGPRAAKLTPAERRVKGHSAGRGCGGR